MSEFQQSVNDHADAKRLYIMPCVRTVYHIA